MSNPQGPEQRSSEKGAATPQEAADAKADMDRKIGPGGSRQAHGTNRGDKGGGEGGGVPPDQQPDHP